MDLVLTVFFSSIVDFILRAIDMLRRITHDVEREIGRQPFFFSSWIAQWTDQHGRIALNDVSNNSAGKQALSGRSGLEHGEIHGEEPFLDNGIDIEGSPFRAPCAKVFLCMRACCCHAPYIGTLVD